MPELFATFHVVSDTNGTVCCAAAAEGMEATKATPATSLSVAPTQALSGEPAAPPQDTGQPPAVIPARELGIVYGSRVSRKNSVSA